jgi:hypothetical protein
MTQAQSDAIDQIRHLVREHFEAGVIALTAEVEESDTHDSTEIVWHGGYARATGLCRIAEKRIRKSGKKKKRD